MEGHVCSLHLQNKDREPIHVMGISKTSDHIQIKIKMPNLSQEPPASSKAYNQGLNDIDDLCTLKSKIKGQNFKHWCVKDQTQYPNQDQYSKPQLGTSSVLQSLKSLLKENRCSFHIQNL